MHFLDLICNTEEEWLSLKPSSLTEKVLEARVAASDFSHASSPPLPEGMWECGCRPGHAQRERTGVPGLWPALANQSCACLTES